MQAIGYLFQREFVNTIKSLIRKPAALIGYLVVFGGFTWFISQQGSSLDEFEYRLVMKEIMLQTFMVLGIFTAYNAIYPKINSGISGFRLADLYMQFTAPISTGSLLTACLLKQLSSGVMISLVMLIQLPMMKTFMMLDTAGIVLYVMSTILTTFATPLLQMIRVFLLRGRPIVAILLRGYSFVCIGLFIIWPVWVGSKEAFRGQSFMTAYIDASHATWLSLMPFFGWLRTIFASPFLGLTTAVIVSIGALFLVCGSGYWYLLKMTDTEWFEETAAVAEKAGIAMEKVRQGEVINPFKLLNNKKRQPPAVYCFRRKGSAALLEKHFLEFRRSKTSFVNIGSIVLVLGGWVLYYFLAQDKSDELYAFALNLLMLLLSMIAMLFGLASRWPREVRNHHLYLIPGSNWSKLMSVTAIGLSRSLLEALLLFPVGCILLGVNFFMAIPCTLTYLMFRHTSILSELISMRLFGRIHHANLRRLVPLFVQMVMIYGSFAFFIFLAMIKTPPLVASYLLSAVVGVLWFTLCTYAVRTIEYPDCYD